MREARSAPRWALSSGKTPPAIDLSGCLLLGVDLSTRLVRCQVVSSKGIWSMLVYQGFEKDWRVSALVLMIGMLTPRGDYRMRGFLRASKSEGQGSPLRFPPYNDRGNCCLNVINQTHLIITPLMAPCATIHTLALQTGRCHLLW